MNINEYKD